MGGQTPPSSMNLHDRISTALHDGRLRTGSLFVVKVSPKGRTNFEDEQDRIYLTSDVEPSTLTHLLELQEHAVISSEILGVADDWSAWVVSYEVASSTQRMLIPLFGEETARLIERAAHRDVILVFTSSEEEDIHTVLEYPLEVSESDLQLIRRHWRTRMAPAAPNRLLQAIDILLGESAAAERPGDAVLCDVTVMFPADLRRELADLMPKSCFE
jgi:hypothetical protein